MANLTLGRGKVYFARFKPNTQTPDGYRYVGNTPEFTLTIDSETLDHYSSDEGIREKDASVPLEVNRSGTLTMDDIHIENVALFFYGEASKITNAASAGVTQTIADVKKGYSYQIGQTSTKPTGDQGLTNVSVAVGASAKALTTDYTVNLDTGVITIVESGTIATGDDITVTYDVRASTRDRALSGAEPVEGALMYIENNPHGVDRDIRMPWVKVTPNGDMSMKGDDWRTIPFSVEALKPESLEAIYIDGRPAYS